VEGPKQTAGKFLGIRRDRRSDNNFNNAARRLQRNIAFDEGHGIASSGSRGYVGRELRSFPNDKEPDLLLMLVGSVLDDQTIQQKLGRDQVLCHLVEKRHAGVDVSHQRGFALDSFRNDTRSILDRRQVMQPAGGVAIVNRGDKDILVRLPAGLVLDAEQVGGEAEREAAAVGGVNLPLPQVVTFPAKTTDIKIERAAQVLARPFCICRRIRCGRKTRGTLLNA
jgi:hypothetical protein